MSSSSTLDDPNTYRSSSIFSNRTASNERTFTRSSKETDRGGSKTSMSKSNSSRMQKTSSLRDITSRNKRTPSDNGASKSSKNITTSSVYGPIADKNTIQYRTEFNIDTSSYPSSTSTQNLSITDSLWYHALPMWAWYIMMGLGSLVIMLLIILCGCAYVLRKRKNLTKIRNRVSTFFLGYETSKTHDERLYTLPNSSTQPRPTMEPRNDLSLKPGTSTFGVAHPQNEQLAFEMFRGMKSSNKAEQKQGMNDKIRHRLPAPPPKPVNADVDNGEYVEMKSSIRRPAPIVTPVEPGRQLTESGYDLTIQKTEVPSSQQGATCNTQVCQSCTARQVFERENSKQGGAPSCTQCDTEADQSFESLKTIISALPGNIVLVNLDNSKNTLKMSKSAQNKEPAQNYFQNEQQPVTPKSRRKGENENTNFPYNYSAKHPVLDRVDVAPGSFSFTPSNPGYGVLSHRDEGVRRLDEQFVYLDHNNDSSDDFSDLSAKDSYYFNKHSSNQSGDYSRAWGTPWPSNTKTSMRGTSGDSDAEEIYDEVCSLDGDQPRKESRNGELESSVKKKFSKQRASVDLK